MIFPSSCCCSVAKPHLAPWDPMDCNTPGSSVLHYSSKVCWNSCPLSQWCHPTISFSVASFSSCPQSFPASGSFPVSWPLASGDQGIGASASVFPMNIQSWLPLELSGLISLLSRGLSRVFSSTPIGKYDKRRQHIKRQRRHFANKGMYSQSYGFSSSHVWMWELDCREGWAPKNWCFWTVVLEKTLESPLDSKEIKPVNPKGNQPWIFIGKTDAEAPIL